MLRNVSELESEVRECPRGPQAAAASACKAAVTSAEPARTCLDSSHTGRRARTAARAQRARSVAHLAASARGLTIVHKSPHRTRRHVSARAAPRLHAGVTPARRAHRYTGKGVVGCELRSVQAPSVAAISRYRSSATRSSAALLAFSIVENFTTRRSARCSSCAPPPRHVLAVRRIPPPQGAPRRRCARPMASCIRPNCASGRKPCAAWARVSGR